MFVDHENLIEVKLIRNRAPKRNDCIQYNRHFVTDIDMDVLLSTFSNDRSMLHRNHKLHPRENENSFISLCICAYTHRTTNWRPVACVLPCFIKQSPVFDRHFCFPET